MFVRVSVPKNFYLNSPFCPSILSVSSWDMTTCLVWSCVFHNQALIWWWFVTKSFSLLESKLFVVKESSFFPHESGFSLRFFFQQRHHDLLQLLLQRHSHRFYTTYTSMLQCKEKTKPIQNMSQYVHLRLLKASCQCFKEDSQLHQNNKNKKKKAKRLRPHCCWTESCGVMELNICTMFSSNPQMIGSTNQIELWPPPNEHPAPSKWGCKHSLTTEYKVQHKKQME